jgi:hypothetical protein
MKRLWLGTSALYNAVLPQRVPGRSNFCHVLQNMSWSKQGSHALALLKIAKHNGQWEHHWNDLPIAA